ncbi:ATP-binding protein [Streptococcus suis]|uniref:ATP-binding protein n=1 Tax=Streptococcus suis TaxID=1307 RepID=UPI00209BF123|nr:ATP-binding protein [Streptococcus suis]MCO8179537.1 ATP-binding protein [Streptococcus suis]
MCLKHQVYLWRTKNKVMVKDETIPRYITCCPECTREKMIEQQIREVGQALDAEMWASSYDIFAKKSIIPNELKDASYKTYTVTSKIEDNAKQFALKLNEFYFKHQGKGNAIIQGKPGIGKSHLTISIAKKLNADWRSISEPKSVLFISVPKMFQRIQEGFGYKDGTSAQQMIDLLTKVDYLFLDDLGKESTFGRQTKEANDWKQNILYQILDERDTTIINTNLTGEQMQKVYDRSLVSRIMKGAMNNVFKYPDNAQSRRELPF